MRMNPGDDVRGFQGIRGAVPAATGDGEIERLKLRQLRAQQVAPLSEIVPVYWQMAQGVCCKIPICTPFCETVRMSPVRVPSTTSGSHPWVALRLDNLGSTPHAGNIGWGNLEDHRVVWPLPLQPPAATTRTVRMSEDILRIVGSRRRCSQSSPCPAQWGTMQQKDQ